MKKINIKKGFTLVELMVVMGIIGILTSVIITQVLPTVAKGSDTAIRADLEGIQTSAIFEFLNLGRKFNNTGTAISSSTAPDCSTLTTVGTIFQNSQIQTALKDIKDQNGGIAPTCNLAADGSGYAIAVTLKTAARFWCIDGTGVTKGHWGIVPSNYYTGQYATPNYAQYALDSATDYACQ